MKLSTFDLAIFDCDGVLVDSEPLANRIFVEIIQEHGFTIDEATYLRKFSGVTLPDRVNGISQDLNWEPPKNFIEIFDKRLAILTEQELKPVPGIHNLLESISIPICIASNGTREEINQRLRLSKLSPFFGDVIFSGHEVPNPKPAPDVYLSAARFFDVLPSRCIVIEDSIPGVTAGVRAGMCVYGHAAFTPTEKLKEAGAIPFADMYQLKEMFAAEYSQQ